MIRNRLVAGLAAALLSGAAPALAGPAPAKAGDARLASRPYNADEVVRIEGRAGVQVTIAFAENEHIENVAIGDSAMWQVTPNKRANLLFVKPLGARAQTNMTVVTDKRSYFFDLVASPAARPVYALRFTYPKEAEAEPAVVGAPALNAEEAQLAAGEAWPTDPAALNFAWQPKGKNNVLPARIYDDGRSTYLSWPAGAPIPAILVRNEKGAEGPVNFAVRGDVIVIDGVPGLLVLRLGRDWGTLENRRPPRRSAPQPAVLAAASAASLASAQDR